LTKTEPIVYVLDNPFYRCDRMSTAIEAHLTQKWREADRQVQALKKENEALRTQVAEFERRQKIAVQNAYDATIPLSFFAIIRQRRFCA
jgi:hypothetical protein